MQGYNIEGNINQTLGKLNDTLNSVKNQAGNAFGLGKQVDQRPWLMIGAALVTGYVLGSAGGKREDDHTEWRASDYASRYNDIVSNKTANKTDTASYYGQSQPDFGASITSSPEYGVEGSMGKPEAARTATFSNATAPRPPVKPQQNLIPESMNKHIDTAISTAGATMRTMLRDAIRDNVPLMRDQVDALDRRDGRIPA